MWECKKLQSGNTWRHILPKSQELYFLLQNMVKDFHDIKYKAPLEEALVTLEFLFLLILRIPLRISPLFPLPPSPLLESLMVNYVSILLLELIVKCDNCTNKCPLESVYSVNEIFHQTADNRGNSDLLQKSCVQSPSITLLNECGDNVSSYPLKIIFLWCWCNLPCTGS